VPDLPALLPEIWLHWDHKTVQERGEDAFRRFRMDFLLLLPRGHRVVLEVDGASHYTAPDGRPDAATYANGVREDRELKFRGYEVFRFGAAELQDRERAHTLLQEFFTELFRCFGISLGIG
jgi:very-short-patch-repair endonuclease